MTNVIFAAERFEVLGRRTPGRRVVPGLLIDFQDRRVGIEARRHLTEVARVEVDRQVRVLNHVIKLAKAGDLDATAWETALMALVPVA